MVLQQGPLNRRSRLKKSALKKDNPFNLFVTAQLLFVIDNFKAQIHRHSDQEIERDRVFLNHFRVPNAIAVRLRLHPTVIITNAFVLSESKSSKQQNKSKNAKHITALDKSNSTTNRL